MKHNLCQVSGVWTGRFEFEKGATESVPFSAWLRSEAGRISGSMLEPNTIFKDKGDELDSSVRGHIDEVEMVFLKTYHGVDQEPVYCEGKVVDNGERIVGRWFHGWPDERTGTFEMKRDALARAESGAEAEHSKT